MNKVIRNEPCHCGSGKKYKKCCIEKDTIAETAVFPINEERDEKDEGFPESNVTYRDYNEPGEPETEAEADEDENIFNLEGDETEEMDSDPISTTKKAYPVISAHDENLIEEWWTALDYEKQFTILPHTCRSVSILMKKRNYSSKRIAQDCMTGYIPTLKQHP